MLRNERRCTRARADNDVLSRKQKKVIDPGCSDACLTHFEIIQIAACISIEVNEEMNGRELKSSK